MSNFSIAKQNFFSAEPTIESTLQYLKQDESNFGFLSKNRSSIEDELNQLFKTLEKNDKERQAFWLFSYYCCKLLQAYWEEDAYNNARLAKSYKKKAAELAALINKKKWSEKQYNDSFGRALAKTIKQDLVALLSTPLSTSDTRSALGNTNLFRLVITFSRISVKQTILMAQNLGWITKLEQWSGHHINVGGMIDVINLPGPLFNVLSVGLFSSRLMISLGLTIKHTFFPNKVEASLPPLERFLNELSKRHYHLGNDIAWASVNALCNYASFFHISAPVANWLTAAFLIFDVTMLVIDHQLEKEKYLLKKAQYKADIDHYLRLIESDTTAQEERIRYAKMVSVFTDQQAELDIKWGATSAYYQFNIAAALILMASFTAPLIFSASIAAVVGYTFCTIAIAMYLTGDDYRRYVNASLVLREFKENKHQTDLTKEIKEVRDARRDFVIAMIKNTLAPLLMVTLFAVCWEAALVLTVLYMASMYTYNTYKKHKEKQKDHADDIDEDYSLEFSAPSPA